MSATESLIERVEGDHKVINVMDYWTFRCPAWGMWWRYDTNEQAAYFLAAHLLYPVAPCAGTLAGKTD